jgi:adenylate cyclase
MSMAPPETERRLTTIVAVDVAGFSRLTSRDEESTLSALRSHRDELIDPTVTAFRGRIANTAGDSLLIEFPSVSNALRFAVAVQHGMRGRNSGIAPENRIEFRIGINVGDVVVAGDDLLGNAVNIASRVEALAAPGGICISRSARDQVRHVAGVGLEDIGEVRVKNIDRPVRVFRVHAGDSAPTGKLMRRPARRVRPVMVAVVLLACIATAGAFWLNDVQHSLLGLDEGARAAAGQASSPVMIVMPFDNLGDDPEQEYFSDGFTEDLTTALSRTPGLLVAARNTAFALKGKLVDAKAVSATVRVRYLLEGSVRRHGERLRVNAQLVDAASQTELWAETFDRPLKELFIVQDELVKQIVGSVASHLRRHEGETVLSASPEKLAAHDLTARARYFFRRNDLASVTEARTLLYRATELDPSYALAFSLLAEVENFFFTNRISDEYASPATAGREVEAARRAIALAPNDAYVRAVHGLALRLLKDFDGAASEARQARDLAPNDPDVLAAIAPTLLAVGDYPGTVETVRQAWALDPYINPLTVGVILSQALFVLGDFKGAREAATSCLQRAPQDVRCQESLVRALGEIGPEQEARAAVRVLLRLSPDYTVTEYIRRARENRRDEDAIRRWAEGLRKAGVPG